MKRRISLTIDRRIIKKIDSLSVYDSRSETIENFLESFIKSNRFAVIAAGGPEKNLYVPELKTYRPLVEIGKKKLIDIMMDNAQKAGFNNFIIIASGNLLVELKKHVKNAIFVDETKHGDTANTLVYAKKNLKSTFLFMPCDHYFNFDLKKLEKIHRSGNFKATIAIYAGARYVWNKSSIVELDGNMIKNYWEYPDNETFLTSTSICLMEPDIFNYIENKKMSLQADVFPCLAKKGELGGGILSGEFVNVHTKKDVEIAKKFEMRMIS